MLKILLKLDIGICKILKLDIRMEQAMNKYLYVETKTVYGSEKLVYPKCERSQVLANEDVGTKTLTEKHMNLIKKLGYEFRPRWTKDLDVNVVNLSDYEGDLPTWFKPHELETKE